MQNYFNMKILSIPENVAFARSTVGAFCAGADPSVEELNDASCGNRLSASPFCE